MENRTVSSWLLEHLGNQEIFRLFIGENTIGRHSMSTLRFVSNFLSRHHAIIDIKEGDTTINIKCLNTLNGVFVNGTRLNGALRELNNMDQISFGISEIPRIIETRDTVFILRRSLLQPNDLIEIDDDDVPIALNEVVPIENKKHQPSSAESPNTPKNAVAFKNNQHTPPSADLPTSSVAEAKPLNNNQGTPPIHDGPTTSRSAMALNNNQGNPPIHDGPTTSIAEMALNNKQHNPPIHDGPTTSRAPMALNNKRQNSPLRDVPTNTGGKVTLRNGEQTAPLPDVSATSGEEALLLKNKLHMPLLPVVKLEGVHNASAKIKDVFGDPDKVILDSMKAINAYVFNNLCNNNVIINNLNDEALMNGNIIDISNEADESDKTKTNMQSTEKQNNNKKINTAHDDENIIVLSDEEDNKDDDEGEEFLFSQVINCDLKKEWGDSDSDCDQFMCKEDIISIKDIISTDKVNAITLPKSEELEAKHNIKRSQPKGSSDDCLNNIPKPCEIGSFNKIQESRRALHSSCFALEKPCSSKQLKILKTSDNIKKSELKETCKNDMPQTNKKSCSSSKLLKRKNSVHSSCIKDEPLEKKIMTSYKHLKELKAPENYETSALDEDYRISDESKVNDKSSDSLDRALKRRHSIHNSCFEEPTEKSTSTSDNRLHNQVSSRLIPSRRKSVATCFNDKQAMLQIIDAPALPKHKGKLRGVSAVSVVDRMRKECRKESNLVELNRKWHTKAIHKKKEVAKIKEVRKDRLKKLADAAKQDLEVEKNNTKNVGNGHKEKISHVSAKVTNINRAALLAKELNQQPAKKIPKISERRKSNVPIIQRTVSVDSRSKQTPNADAEKHQTQEAQKPVRAVRVSNKLTFAKMESAFEKQQELDKKKAIETPVTSDSLETVKKIGKTVRFNDVPIIHLIEPCSGANRKVDRIKDFPAIIASTYQSRRDAMLRKYSFVDYKASITLDILRWSNQCLEVRSGNEDTILPMPNEFVSFEHYKSVIIPLMKLEIQNSIENAYKSKTKSFNVSMENVYKENGHFKLITKGKSSDISKYDLYVITFGNNSKSETFAYLQSMRKGNDYGTLEFCIDAGNFTELFLLNQRTLTVRPIVDNIRVEFGVLNAVYHLKNTPLFEKIIDPLNINSREEQKKTGIMTRSPSYEGFNAFNTGQLKALLDTYSKVINDLEPNITLIHGPPGTGKSSLIANLAVQCLFGGEVRFRDRKILICSHTNTAINSITVRFKNIIEKSVDHKKIRVIRFGMKDRMCSKSQEFSLENFIDQFKETKINQILSTEQRVHYSRRTLQLKDELKELRSRNYKGTFLEDEILAKEKELKHIKFEINKHFTIHDERTAIKQILEETDIVCTTLSSCVKLTQYIQYFDICIIDEATQCTEPWSLLPLRFGIPSLVLVGDTQQLPATVMSTKASELGLKKSMFSRIQNCLEQKGATATDGIVHQLTTQYRMHPEICKWPNEYFYRNSLYNGTSTLKQVTDILPYCVFDLKYTKNEMISHGKITNKMEAEFITKLLSVVLKHISIQSNSYVVLTPYTSQIDTLKTEYKRQKLPYISTNTIDAYQGLQRDVVVISNARSSGVGFLANYQRLNVALTRSRKCLILCGNFRDLERVPVWKYLLQDARVRNLYFAIEKPFSSEDLHTHVLPKLLTKKK